MRVRLCSSVLDSVQIAKADTQLSADLEKEGGRRKEDGREGGMEGGLFIQSKKSERGFLLTPKNKDGRW